MSTKKVIGKVFHVTSDIDAALVKKANKLAPDTLIVKDGDGKQLYKLCVDNSATGSLGKFGVTFNAVQGGKLSLNVPVDKGTQAEIESEYGVALVSLAKYESVIIAQINESLGAIQEAVGNIETEATETTEA